LKFTCQKEDLLRVFSAGKSITGSKTNFSILSNLLFETKGEDAVTIKASNVDTTLEALIPAKVAESGSITIVQDKLAKIVGQLPTAEVLFELDKGNAVKVRSLDKKRDAKAVIIGAPKADFPDIPDFPAAGKTLTVDMMYFRKMIQKTLFAVAESSANYTLNGVLFESSGGLMKMVAIDGRRLAIIQAPLPGKDEPEFSLIIPRGVLQQLLDMIHGEGPLTVASTENRVHFRMERFTLSSNVLTGKFPNYNMFIPAQHTHGFVVNTAELRSAIGLAAVLAEGDSQKMLWNLSGNALNVSAQNTDYGKSEETLFVQYKGEDQSIGINYKLMNDILKEIETEEAEFHFNNALSPILIREKDRKEYFFIIMPMRLDNA
jgi:DNA polymerase-3 subunit beta